ncbi:alpha/beta fold hydrolase [Aspergillus stella-maris]|uniref:alpha/beta fold hydrolase n=1 Tax=Aspergillus stella-maris TaxID=1810926 RepID=UPI003CCD4814
MDSFHRKELVTRRGLKYTYYVSPTGNPTHQSPTLIFLHGFPDSAHLWTDVISALGPLPNRIIIPDCLGYAGTAKPTDTTLYAYKDQAEDLADILHTEDATTSIIIGHDWGSALAQRTYLHKPHLFTAVVLVNIGYMVPATEPFDLAAFNAYTKKTIGYPQFAYWDFFTAPDADAVPIVENNLERMWQVLHGDVDDWMKILFCAPNAMRDFLLGAKNVPLKPYAQQSRWKNAFMHQFRPGEFASALHAYKAAAWNIQYASDSTIPRDKFAIEVPLLFIACTKDSVCRPELMDAAKGLGLVPRLKEVTVEAGHWSPMERPGEIAGHIREFLGGLGTVYPARY